MACLYVFHFRNHPELIKVGFTIAIDKRQESLGKWGPLLDDSVYFELPTRELAFEIEACLKKIFATHNQELRGNLPNYAGKTEVVSARHYDYVVNFIRNYVNLPTGVALAPKPVPITELEATDLNNLPTPESLEVQVVGIGAKLRGLRLERNMSRETLAELAGIGVGIVSAAEQGKCKLENLVLMLNILGYSNWFSTFPSSVGTRRQNAYNKRTK